LVVWFLAAPAARAALNVVATLPDYAAIAQAVGGDLVKVTAIARGSEDPHFVDARPSFITFLNKADVLLEGGLDLEAGWLPTLLGSARNPKILADAPGHVLLSRGIRVLDVPGGPVDRSMGDVHPMGNPHCWLDPANGKVMAGTVAAALARLDPAHAAMFETNRVKFDRRLDEKLEQWTRRLDPLRGAKVLTYHKSFEYLLARFGLELAGTIEPKPGIEPSPTHIAGLIPRAKELGVKLVLIEPNRPRATPARVAEAIGARLIVLPVMVGGNEKIKDYFDLFDYAVDQLAGAGKP
jgi:ABC-type Zn uptake system ZnuABC Zn-binding protein ZnuA